MTRVILEHILHLIMVLPIVLFTMRTRNLESFKVLLAFSIFFMLNSILLYLPIEFNELRIIDGKWNWTGKIFSIFGAVIFLLVYRKLQLKDYFLTFKQHKKNLKKGILIISVIFLVSTILNFTFNSSKAWNTETILYQLTMPGINEEIAYRGILLGLLVKTLKNYTFFNPAILITAILFGMAHGLFLNNDFELVFKTQAFFETMIMGIIWAWVTIKTGSILLALISHNLGNVSGKLISMMK